MEIVINNADPILLALDLLADMSLLVIARDERILAPPEVRKAVLHIMDIEMEELMDIEQTLDLLGWDEFRVVA